MRRVLWLVFVACSGVAACGLNTQATGVGSQPDSGLTGGSGGGGGAGGGTSNCFPSSGQKFCGGQNCPPTTDPQYGCAQSSCAACDVPNATAKCAADGTCTLDTCDPGFTDCDGNAANGCEINTAQDPSNCGTCGHNCSAKNPGTNWICNQGACQVSTCPTGKGDCNHNPADACEVDLDTDPNNCGFCGNVCNIPHATAACVNGKCTLAKCDPGWTDCNNNPADGCEQDTNTDPNHCGSCTNVCGTANGKPACVGGNCTISCAAPYANCDGNVKNGCETDLNTDAKHCGTCANACGTTNAAPTCSGGKCQLNCKTGFDSCDGNVSTGCETNLNTDSSNCGKCNNACPGGEPCKNGSCQCTPKTCASYPGQCGSLSDGCGGTITCNCGGGQTCNSGTCCTKKTCASYQGQCGSLSDGCGGTISCNCGGGQVCNSGTCCTKATCAAGQCGTVSDGCGGTLSCGTCGTGQTCNSGSCACDSGYATCNTNPLQCTAWDNSHCGATCKDCTQDSAYCSNAGVCCYPHNNGAYNCNANTSVPCCTSSDTCHGNGKCY